MFLPLRVRVRVTQARALLRYREERSAWSAERAFGKRWSLWLGRMTTMVFVGRR